MDAATKGMIVEFRRRHDLLLAVINRSREVWQEIESLSAEVQAAKQSKWVKFWGAVFVALLVLHWWTKPSEKFEFTFLNSTALFIWLGFMGYMYEMTSKEKRLRTMRDLQRDLLFHWESCGADQTTFWQLRDLQRQLDKLTNTEWPIRAEALNTQVEEVEERISRVWEQVQRGQLSRIGAEPPYDGYL